MNANTKTYLLIGAAVLAALGAAVGQYANGGLTLAALASDFAPVASAVAVIFHIGEQHS